MLDKCIDSLVGTNFSSRTPTLVVSVHIHVPRLSSMAEIPTCVPANTMAASSSKWTLDKLRDAKQQAWDAEQR